VITALCHDGPLAAVEETLLRETGTLGVRRTSIRRRALPRATSRIALDGAEVRVKTGPHRAKPEHDDLLAIARDTGLPLRQVADRATAAVQQTTDQRGAVP
jgi:uncharacterized protein (DUF111 family)